MTRRVGSVVYRLKIIALNNWREGSALLIYDERRIWSDFYVGMLKRD